MAIQLQPSDVSSINGITTSTGNGSADSGTQRVVIANDNTAIPVGLPSGASTSANQTTINTSLGTINTSINTLDTDLKSTQPRKLQDGSGNAVTSQVSGTQRALDVGINVSGTQVDPRSIRALTNSDVVKAQLQDNAGTAVTVGQKAMSSSLPVAIASDQGAVPASQSGTWTIQPGNTPNTTAWNTSLGNSTGKTNVMKTGALASSATTADQVILTYTVTSGKTFYLEYFDCIARLTTYAATATLFGAFSLETPSGTKVYTSDMFNAGAASPTQITFSEPVPIAASTVIRIVCTPSASTAMSWKANFGGYEK